MLTTGPFPIGSADVVKVPYPTNAPINRVVIDNLSPFAVTVAIGAAQSWLPPWTSNLFPVPTNTHQPFVITAETAPLQAAGELTVTWFSATDTVPGGIYPQALTPVAPNGTPEQVDSVGAFAPGDHVLATVSAPIYVVRAKLTVLDATGAAAGDYATVEFTPGLGTPFLLVPLIDGATDTAGGFSEPASPTDEGSFVLTVHSAISPVLAVVINYLEMFGA